MTSLYENHQFIVPLMMKLNSKFSFSNFYHHLGCLTYTFPMSSDHGRSKLQNAYNELRFDFKKDRTETLVEFPDHILNDYVQIHLI